MKRSAKNKGRAGEHEVAALLGGKRTPLSGRIPGTADVSLPPPFDGLWVEVKRRAKLPAFFTEAMAQARYAKTKLTVPVVAIRADGDRWAICFDGEEFRQWALALAQQGSGFIIRQHLQRIMQEVQAIKDRL